MKKKLIISVSIIAFILIAITAIGLYSLEVRQEYQYNISYKPDGQSKKIVDDLKNKMRTIGYKGKYCIKEGSLGAPIGANKFFICSGPDSEGEYDLSFTYGCNGSFWTLGNQKGKYDKICNEIITPGISKLKVTSNSGTNTSCYEQGKRYKIFWCIEF